MLVVSISFLTSRAHDYSMESRSDAPSEASVAAGELPGSSGLPASLAEQSDLNTGPQPVVIELMMVGDILVHDEVLQNGLQPDGSYDFSFIFSNIGGYIEAADLRILNQETIMGLPEKGYDLVVEEDGTPVFNTPVELADAEVAAGFNVIIKATNHSFDHAYDGLAHELDYWRDHYPDVPVLGVDNPYDRRGDQDWVHNVYMFEKDGFKVALLNYTFGTNSFYDLTTDRDIVSYLDETRIRADVAKARSAGADMIVACPHWGMEYKTEPSEEELRYAGLFRELGVDVIFGTHPHIMQPVEVTVDGNGHRTVCFFSNGSFIAADGFAETSLIGGISRATLVKEPDGSCRVAAASIVPVIACHGEAHDMSVYPVGDYPDEIARRSNRPALTASYADDFCADVFGDGYDRRLHVYTVDLGEQEAGGDPVPVE